MSDEKKLTWTQALIAEISEVEGAPDWVKFRQVGFRNPFALATFSDVKAEAVGTFAKMGYLKPPGDNSHASLSVGAEGWEIKIFTAAGDAPADCREV